MASAFPSHVGPYRILGPLGKGGMGLVHRAQQGAAPEVALRNMAAAASQIYVAMLGTIVRLRPSPLEVVS